MRKTTAETLVQLRLESVTAAAGRSTHILLAAGKDGIQLLAVGGRHVLYIRNVLQPAFYLERRGTGIEQSLQLLTLVEILE